jgi:hypothetical protein
MFTNTPVTNQPIQESVWVRIISKSLPQLMSQWNIDRIQATSFATKIYSQVICCTTHKSLNLHGFNSVLQPKGLSTKRLDHYIISVTPILQQFEK